MKRSKGGRLDEPTMSDQTILVSVEDLINMAMGPPNKNVVNYKLIQSILLILARQLRMLEQKVDVRIIERSPSPSESGSPRRPVRKEKRKTSREKSTPREKSKDKEKGEKAVDKVKDQSDRSSSKERNREDKHAAKDKEKSQKDREKDDGKAAKDTEKSDRASSKEREREERQATKDTEKAQKDRERDDRHASKDKETADRAASKEREREDKLAAKDKAKAEKEREREDRQTSKNKEKADRAASKEREKEDKYAAKDKVKAEMEHEREDKQTAKDKEKADRAASKERDREDKYAAKDKAKSEKEREREDKQASKEREKADRASSKEREKEDRHAAKDRDKMEREQDKASAKERGKIEKEKEKPVKDYEKAKERSKAGSATSIAISEKRDKGKDKVLVVEKGPTTRSDTRTRVGSIEVVTVSQFELLEKAVRELSARAAPTPLPSLPDNKKLRSQLAQGSASLTDTMQAMQVTARVHAAEEAITRMADLLTQLAASGALPEELAEKVESELQESMAAASEAVTARPALSEVRPTARATARQSVASRKSVAIEPGALKSSLAKPSSMAQPSTASAGAPRASSVGRPSTVSVVPSAGRPSTASTAPSMGRVSLSAQSSTGPKVTHKDMEDELRDLREQLTKTVQNLTTRATSAADTATATVKGLAEKMDVALKLDNRIGTLYSLVSDYAEQLSGFDTGLVTQMQSFQEQMALMRSDLRGGLTLLESANNNAETAAVLELTERCTALSSELDRTLLAHQGLSALQAQLADELRGLVESVEMLREQKADRDEVLDGLRDKADLTRLAGLLRDEEFLQVRLELERRLQMCYDKFQKQDNVWMSALRDLTNITEEKAQIMQLLALKDNTQAELRDLHEKLRLLARLLGEPKAALLARRLARDAACGACGVPALMQPSEPSHGAPLPLPALRPAPTAPPEPYPHELLPPPEEDKRHMCKRWVGGSHTLLREGVTHTQAAPVDFHGAPTRRYVGHGDDGQLYMMEEELQPCEQCNQFAGDKDGEGEAGAGDRGQKSTVVIEEPK